jgi:hypothetical protein
MCVGVLSDVCQCATSTPGASRGQEGVRVSGTGIASMCSLGIKLGSSRVAGSALHCRAISTALCVWVCVSSFAYSFKQGLSLNLELHCRLKTSKFPLSPLLLGLYRYIQYAWLVCWNMNSGSQNCSASSPNCGTISLAPKYILNRNENLCL